MVLSLGATGCKTKKPGLTELGGGRKPPGEEIGNAPPVEPGMGLDPSTQFHPPNASGQHAGWVENAEMFKSQTVYFEVDSSAVKADEQSKVSAVADYLKSNSANAVRVEGHCDERGTEEYNRSLGDRRALTLREELIRVGIDPGRVDTISYGEDRPADPGHSEGAWTRNRRAEFILLSPP